MKTFISLVIWTAMLLMCPMYRCLGSVVNPNDVYTYDELAKDIEEIGVIYNQETRIETIGYSHFGRKIWAVKMGKGTSNILIMGSHHGREWLTTSLLMEMLEQYAEAYHKKQKYGPFSTEIFDEIAIWFVPMVNPDGVTIQQHGLLKVPTTHREQLFFMNAFSPDFSKWKANGVGVDLNRQYPAGWEGLSEGPSMPWYQFYRGKSPLEAKEVKALISFTNKIRPEIAVSYHSSGREIFWNYYNGHRLKRDRQLAKKVSKLTGYALSKPKKNAVGGGYTDWFITAYHQPGMTIEISHPVGETNPPLSIFKEEWKRNKLVGIMLATEAEKRQQVKGKTHNNIH